MADNKTKEFFIKINGIKESVTNLESLESVLSTMEKQVENINKNGGFSVVSKEANKNTKEAIDLAKAEEIAQGEVISSYKEKQKALTTIGKEIKIMTAADEESIKRQQELIGEYNNLNSTLKSFDASMGNHQRNVGDYRNSIKDATAHLKSLKDQMVGLDQHSTQFKNLANEAGKLKDKISDVNDAIKREASDTKHLDAVIDYAKSATAAFQLYKGAMSAFGVETKEAEEAMQQLMGAMSIVQSLQTLSETLQSTTATGKLFHKMLQMIGLESKNAAASTTALATAEGTAATAGKGLNVVLKATKLALASLGIGLVIMAVAELVEHWEDLCNWFNKSFPIFNRAGGFMNTLKSTAMGLGKAVINWLINPWKTFADVMGKLLKGDFTGAWNAAMEGVKNQFEGTAKAFKEGFIKQAEKGLEELSLKALEETNKQTQQELKELKIRERNNKTYSKKYIDLQKKDFAERKRLAKGNKDELNKIKLEEMQFFADVEDKKTAAAKSGASSRTAAAKKEAADAKKAEEERKKEEEKARDFRIKSQEKLYKSTVEYQKLFKQQEIAAAEAEVKRYEGGPVEKYTEAVEKLNGKLKELNILTRQGKLYDYFGDYRSNIDASIESLDDFMTAMNNIVKKSQNYGKVVSTDLFAEFAKENEIFKNLTKEQYKYLYGIYIEYVKDGVEDKERLEAETNEKIAKQTIDINKKTIDKTTALIKKSTLEDAPKLLDVYQQIFNPTKGKKSVEDYKKYWEDVLYQTKYYESTLLGTWDTYLYSVKRIYGEESVEYIKALEEKKKALQEFYDLQNRASQGSTGKIVPINGSIRNQSEINPNESRTNADGSTNWQALWNPKAEWYENAENLFGLMEDTILGPAMDTFTMYMDFAIEETQKKLEIVQEMHDEALEKVDESANKIKELNDSLKDSSNTNIEATKQQLADEQNLYAQRFAEEQKLAERERDLTNKANEQEYQSRKMELGYQLVMGVANTALGASKALSQWGWPLGAVFAGIMAGLGAVQTALIAKQMASLPKPRKLADGGILTGPSHSAGGIKLGNIEVEGGEAVINKRSTEKYRGLLDVINAAGNGGKHTLADKKIRKFANGGTINFEKVDSNLRQNAETNKLIHAIEGIDMQPVVSVVDFENVQNRLVKVRSLAGR